MMLARAVDGLADVYQHTERYVEAEQLYRESVSLWKRLLGDGQPRVGISLYNLGLTYVALDRPDDARRTLTRALDVFEASLGRESGYAVDTRRALERLADG
jgi:tetratricopeptide (TPR) repeat protein